MNDHVHIVVLRSKYRIEYLVNQLKGAATAALKLKRTPWTRGCWKVFINDDPPVAGLPPQHWGFVTPLPGEE